METTGQRGRWISYGSGPGGKDHLPPDVRAEAEQREALGKEHQVLSIKGVTALAEWGVDIVLDYHNAA